MPNLTKKPEPVKPPRHKLAGPGVDVPQHDLSAVGDAELVGELVRRGWRTIRKESLPEPKLPTLKGVKR